MLHQVFTVSTVRPREGRRVSLCRSQEKYPVDVDKGPRALADKKARNIQHSFTDTAGYLGKFLFSRIPNSEAGNILAMVQKCIPYPEVFLSADEYLWPVSVKRYSGDLLPF